MISHLVAGAAHEPSLRTHLSCRSYRLVLASGLTTGSTVTDAMLIDTASASMAAVGGEGGDGGPGPETTA